MPLSTEKKFLYSRVTIIALFAGGFIFAFAGFNGFPLWYGGFVLCFWSALGMLNYSERSSIWLLHARPWFFALFYASLASTAFLADTFGLGMHLWFYPFYEGWGLLWVWLVLYPIGGLTVLELLYVLSGWFGEHLRFEEHKGTAWHRFLDVFEYIVFLSLIAAVAAGAAGIEIAITAPLTLILAMVWIPAALVKFWSHTRHPGHYATFIALTALLAAISHGLPGTIAREWVYLDAPFLALSILGLPLFVWIDWFLFTLFPLRLWLFITLHPRVR
ncbi:MAG TPA: hypothetical protein DEP25_02505 [Candidatus Taylorbacteria bacterium]|nr:hypothetical protein [Candidatus Taylorbacteria bacterium]